MSRKYQQIKTYSKIMKYKRQTGQIQQVPLSKLVPKKQDKMEEEQYHPEQVPDGEFQDQFQDQYQEEEGWVSDSAGQDQNQDKIQGEQDGTIQNQQQQVKKNKNKKQKPQIWMGTKKNLKKGQILDFDNNAYDMLHRLNNEWPSLSIDFISQQSPFSALRQYEKMTKYPYEVYTVQGSSNNTQSNSIYLTKWLKLHKTKYDDDPQIEGDSQDQDIGNDQEAEIIAQYIQTTFNVNRIKTLRNSPIIALWNDQGQIHIMDLTKNYQKLQNNIGTKKRQPAHRIVLNNDSQGFAINWNPHKIGQLATGNILGQLSIFQNNQSYTSWSKTHEYTYHKGSIQDIIYSPQQPTVFASCSSDGTLQIVDTRVGDMKKSQLLIKAHQKDVNVCDWSRSASNLIVTGSDDCSVKVWDLRKLQNNKKSQTEELLSFNWHTQPITSIKFQPNQQSVIAVASEDNSISIWDMAMQNQQQDPQVPNELMFIHQGQQQIKQIAFHPVYYEMIISSALDGINIFKPSYQMPEDNGDGDGDGKEDLKGMKKQPIREEDLDQYLEKMKKKNQKNNK